MIVINIPNQREIQVTGCSKELSQTKISEIASKYDILVKENQVFENFKYSRSGHIPKGYSHTLHY